MLPQPCLPLGYLLLRTALPGTTYSYFLVPFIQDQPAFLSHIKPLLMARRQGSLVFIMTLLLAANKDSLWFHSGVEEGALHQGILTNGH